MMEEALCGNISFRIIFFFSFHIFSLKLINGLFQIWIIAKRIIIAQQKLWSILRWKIGKWRIIFYCSWSINPVYICCIFLLCRVEGGSFLNFLLIVKFSKTKVFCVLVVKNGTHAMCVLDLFYDFRFSWRWSFTRFMC